MKSLEICVINSKFKRSRNSWKVRHSGPHHELNSFVRKCVWSCRNNFVIYYFESQKGLRLFIFGISAIILFSIWFWNANGSFGVLNKFYALNNFTANIRKTTEWMPKWFSLAFGCDYTLCIIKYWNRTISHYAGEFNCLAHSPTEKST